MEPLAATDGTSVALDDAGRALIETEFGGPGAKIVFFGARE